MIPQPMHGDAKVPVFNAHIRAGRFSSEQKHGLADALNQALVQGLGILEGDRFIISVSMAKTSCSSTRLSWISIAGLMR
jgi:hypothetical protein